MKKYEYVTLHVSGMCGLFGSKLETHRTTIDQYAARGYRYVGYFPVKIGSYGYPTDIDLIFEQDTETE